MTDPTSAPRAETSRPTTTQWVLVGIVSGLPVLLGLVLNAMRPDLIAPMLDHIFGFALVGLVLIILFATLCVSTVGTFWTNRAATSRGRAVRQVVTTLVPFILCTLPACFLLMFGPVVFAFMFGASP